MCTHIVFFGAPRYALVWLPWLALLWAVADADRTVALAGPRATVLESFDSGVASRG